MSCEITIINAKIFAPETPNGFTESGFISFNAGRITAVGEMKNFLPLPEKKLINAAGGLAMPGLVNAHNHAAMTLFRGVADDLPLMTWLQEHIFPAEARFVSPEMVYWCSKLAAAEMIMSGTTTVADAYFYEEEAARAFVESGIRAVAAQGVIDFPAPGVPDPAENIEVATDFIERWLGKDLICPAVFAHSPYTCSAKTLKAAKALCRSANVPFFIHLAETRIEQNLLADRWQGSPTAYLHSLGLLDPDTICVHSVWLDKNDIDLVASCGSAIVTCPQSNMKLASGVAPVAELLAAGVPVALGTDGCASNNDLDLFGEMDSCAKLHKVRSLDPSIVGARKVLHMATSQGGNLPGFGGTGSVAVGMPADIIIIDLHQPHLCPFYSIDSLVYAAGGGDVSSVFINGQVIMHDRQILTFNVVETMEMVAKLARRVAGV